MAKQLAKYVCKSCNTTTTKWNGRCLSCGAWDSLEQMMSQVGVKRSAAAPVAVEKLSRSNGTKLVRYSTKISEVDKVLGGGIVPGSLILLAGDPGIGKSTLVLQIANLLNKSLDILYVSGEESASQIKLRADRLVNSTHDFDFVSTNDIDGVISLCETKHYDCVVIDSIQTLYSSTIESSVAGVAQITNNTALLGRVAKKYNTAFLVVGHVTKEGNLAGPRLLEHLVDTVLYLEGERSGGFKLLRSVKNRFGSTNEVGIFEMDSKGLREVKNPSAHLLHGRQSSPGSIVFATMEGTRPLLVEVQALVAPTVFGYPKRTAVGVDLNRLQLLTAVASKRSDLRLSDKDIYVNIVGGLKIIEPAVDIAIILAIATSLKSIIPPPQLAVFGEVGLSGEIRAVANTSRRIAEAKQLGFTTILGPTGKEAGLTLAPKNIAEAISDITNISKK